MNKPEYVCNVGEKGGRLCLQTAHCTDTKRWKNALVWLLPNMGKMSPSCPVEMPLDQPHRQRYSLLTKSEGRMA
jgi:hypothetical protein